jgi:hypothetical protein
LTAIGPSDERPVTVTDLCPVEEPVERPVDGPVDIRRRPGDPLVFHMRSTDHRAIRSTFTTAVTGCEYRDLKRLCGLSTGPSYYDYYGIFQALSKTEKRPWKSA